MASVEEQTEQGFYGSPLYKRLHLPEFRSKEEIKEGLTSLGIGPVTGTLGLPSDILDLANLANDLSADYTGNVLAKAIQPKLNKLQEKYGRDAFDKGFTELTGIKSDASDVNQMVGELVSLGGLAKAGISGAKTATKAVKDVAEQTKQAFQPQAVTPEGFTMPVPEQPKGGQVDKMIGGPEAIKGLYGKGVGKQRIDELKQKYPESMRPFISADTIKYDEYKTLQNRHNQILKNNDIDTIFKELNDKEVEDVKMAAMSEFAAQYAIDNNLKVSDALMNVMFDADAPPVDFKKYLNKELVAKYLAQKRFAETGVYIGRASKKLKKAPMTESELSQSQLRFEIPDIDATIIKDGANKLKTSSVKLSDLLDHRLLYDAYGKNIDDISYVGIEKRKDARKYLESQGIPKEVAGEKKFFNPIGEIKVIPDPDMQKGTAAWYSEASDTIGVDPNRINTSAFRSDLLHEIQHAVQNREGFESGASLKNYLPSSIRNFETITGKPYSKETFEELYTLRARHSNFIDIIYSDVPLAARMTRIVRKPEIEAIKIIAQNIARRMDAITKKTGQVNFEQQFITSSISDLNRDKVKKLLDNIIQPEDFDLIQRSRNGVKIDGRKIGNILSLKKTHIDGSLVADIDSDKTIKLNKKVEELFRKLPKDPEERMRLLRPFVDIALQEQMYTKAKSKALENYRLTAGELESQTVEARDAFAQRLLKQGKSKEDIIKELYKTHPIFRRVDYSFDKQRGLDVPEGVYPRKESDIVYLSEKFEETPIERATKETDDMLINMLGDEGIGAEHPNIQEAVNKYVYDVDKSGIEKAIAGSDYPAYKADLDRILRRNFPDGKIPVTRIINYAEVQALKEKPKKVKSILDIEDVAFAGNEAERELIANLNGDLTSFSIDNVKNKMNKGGVPTMANKNLESQQLELFGGLKDQGGMKDPATGNEVPVGSTKKEVRDDIPAQLSEGEFVLPSDVVRYHGLEKIMGLRDQAKQGLNKMEAMGQMGNPDEATLPDNTPFMANTGGIAGVNIQDPSQLQTQQSLFQTTKPLGQQKAVATPTVPIKQPPSTPPIIKPVAPSPIVKKPLTFKETMGIEAGKLPTSETKLYKNPETGETKPITFINGEPIHPIPEGYIPIEESGVEGAETPTTTPSSVQQTTTPVEKDDRQPPAVKSSGSFNLGDINLGSLALGAIFGPVGSMLGKLGQKEETKPLLSDKPYENLSMAKQQMGGYKILGDITATGKKGTGVGDEEIKTGGIFNDKFAVAVDNSNLATWGGPAKNADGHTVYRTIGETAKAIKSAFKSGWFGGPVGPMVYDGLDNEKKESYNKFANEMGLTQQNYTTEEGQQFLKNYQNTKSQHNISGVNQTMPTSLGDGYLVTDGKAYKGSYNINETSGDMQFEKADGSGTIVAVSKKDGEPALVGDLTGTGEKTKVVSISKPEKSQPDLEAEYRKEQERKAASQAFAAQHLIDEQERRRQDAEDRKRQEKEERAKEEKAFKDFKERDEKKSGKVSGYGAAFKKGGLMTKPKVMNMKRGGLASRR